MYEIEVRDYAGVVLASGQSHEGEEALEALLRIGQAAGLVAQGDRIATSEYFTTQAGRPYGTWHIQFGHDVPSVNSASLGRTFVVHVDEG